MKQREPVKHRGTLPIQTERLLLRRFTQDDAPDVLANWAGDGRVTRWLTWQTQTELSETQEMVDAWCEGYEDDNCYNWAIELDGRVIGSVSVEAFASRSGWCSLGYALGTAWQGKGLMTEAVGAVCAYLFETGFHRIEIEHAADNPASGRVAEKCGFEKEGVRRARTWSVNLEKFVDVVLYAKLNPKES